MRGGNILLTRLRERIHAERRLRSELRKIERIKGRAYGIVVGLESVGDYMLTQVRLIWPILSTLSHYSRINRILFDILSTRHMYPMMSLMDLQNIHPATSMSEMRGADG
jgi:hypothetical protein